MTEPWPCPDDIGEEVAAHLAQCLHRIAHDFEGCHFGQIRRHRESIPRPTCPAQTCHERQLHLFGEPCPPF